MTVDRASFETGLSGEAAAARLREFGPNCLPDPERRNLARIIFDIVRQPMFALLLAGAGVYVLLGEAIDAAVLVLFATLSVSISVVQESRSERVLESLRDLASPRALVLRDGKRIRIAARELVPGDVIILGEGDRVPADAMLLSGAGLLADESLLTGESLPVRKKPGAPDLPGGPPGGDDLPCVFAGTLIAQGTGIARVVATGLRSEMGRIGQALKTITLEQPRLQQQLKWLVRNFALTGVAVAGLVVLLFGLSRGSWLQAMLAGIAIGMSVLPEEIPLVLAVFMAMGAWRISRAGVLTRHSAAIETLGSATVLCTDKTGTLTENRMQVALIVAGETIWQPGMPLDEASEDLLHAALGASAPLPTDPMDVAIHQAALRAEQALPQGLLQSYGLHPDLPATTNLWGSPDGLAVAAHAKGSPEAIFELCNLPPVERERLHAKMDSFAARGIRLLGVAEATLMPAQGAYPPSQRDIPFSFTGLIGFADPLRATAPAAVRECREAGIRVIMITGDYPATARAIAAQAGIDGSAVISGDELAALDEAALAGVARTACVFARIRPQQKLRLVEALKRNGDVVAMTGDGVNDAPAIKAAHIGIAMGGRGTDVAREASALVLLQDDFASIVATIRLGRRIYDNLQKAIAYIIAVHVPIAGLALLPLLFGLPLMLMPIHIALLEMVIDPACSLVFESEKEEADVMRRPPRASGVPVMPRAAVLWAALQGLAALAMVALALFLGLQWKVTENELRSLVFATLVLLNIGLIVANRSLNASLADTLRRPNPILWILVSTVMLVLMAAIYWRPVQQLFHFGPMHPGEVAACLVAGMVLVGLLEAGKRWRR
jgi:Ca2+-transporting ATPase